MQARTISENLDALLGDDRRVLAAVFTTFNFEPDFFEEEIIPLLLDHGVALSTDRQVKSIQIRQALNDFHLPVEVFHDRNMFRLRADKSPAMEYLHHGVDRAPYAFHPKLSLILIESKEKDRCQLLVGAGSANLTQAGWWENIECQHWEVVNESGAPARFLEQLASDVAFLADCRVMRPESGLCALDLIAEFVARCSIAFDALPVLYFGIAKASSPTEDTGSSFIDFLARVTETIREENETVHLDIISPYFAEDATFDGHRLILDVTNVEKINLFLPTNEHGDAMCTEAYYRAIDEAEQVTWCGWSDGMRGVLGMDDNAYRRTHAKIYHFRSNAMSAVVTGSINFTRYAFNHNIEAGICSDPGHSRSMLKPLEKQPTNFGEAETLREDELGTSHPAPACAVHLMFDWKTHTLSGRVEGVARARLTLRDGERRPMAQNLMVTLDARPLAIDAEPLVRLLQESGFIYVSATYCADETEHVAQQVLVQQVNWTHKPLDVARLSPQQILELYAGMRFEGRIQLVAKLREDRLKQLLLGGQTVSQAPYEDSGRQFFSEYAEMFQGFRNLRRRIHDARVNGQERQVDYYLTGAGVDSLPTLFESLIEPGCDLDAATRYLAMLCLLDIYQSDEFAAAYGADTWRDRTRRELEKIEHSGDLSLTNDNGGRPDRFFAWFREAFFKQYRPNVSSDDDAKN